MTFEGWVRFVCFQGAGHAQQMTENELRVFALRSRRKNPIGRTRGGEDLGGELWKFHLGRSVAGARAAAQRLRSNELRVFALRSRRKNPVGRTRGGEDLGGELWRFHLGRSVAGGQVGAHPLPSYAVGRPMAGRRGGGGGVGGGLRGAGAGGGGGGGRGAVGIVVGVIGATVTAVGDGGDSDALWRAAAREGRIEHGWEKGADHGPMADLRGSVRMKINRPW